VRRRSASARSTRDATVDGAPARGVDAFGKHRGAAIRRDRDRRSIQETPSAIPESSAAAPRIDARVRRGMTATRALDVRVALLW
jgi:hypothetical protein